jgi:Disulphide bond corrector protein DsbC
VLKFTGGVFHVKQSSYLLLAVLAVAAGITPLAAIPGLAGAFAHPQDGGASQALANAASLVKPHVFVSATPAPQGSAFEVAVVVDIASGYHMNSHKPLDEFLIPTTLTPQPPAGLKPGEVIYPAGQSRTFSFSPNKPLSVYSGKATLRLKFQVAADAAVGTQSIPMTLRYQACNETSCLPPVKVPVTATVEIAAAGTKSHPTNPEIFAPASGSKQ